MTDARVVLADEILEHGAVAVIDGVIQEVAEAEHLLANGLPVLDARGAFCLPGLVNIHDDEIETETNPRPQTNLPLPFARRNYIRRALAAGVTTTWYAIAFADMPMAAASPRTVEAAQRIATLIQDDPCRGGLDQYVLPRFRADRGDWLRDAVFPAMDSSPLQGAALLGAGRRDQEGEPPRYPDPEVCRAILEAYFSPGKERVEASLLDAEPGALSPEERLAQVFALIRRRQREAPFALFSHDDDSPDKVDLMHAIGVTVCEMPVEMAAVERAKRLGMAVSVGAPNIARGGSTRGKLKGADLVAAGVADVIVADYHTPSLLYAVFEVARLGCTDLPAAVQLATAHPAAVMGHHDRGSIEPGKRADLVIVDTDEGVPEARATVTAGRVRYVADPPGWPWVGETRGPEAASAALESRS